MTMEAIEFVENNLIIALDEIKEPQKEYKKWELKITVVWDKGVAFISERHTNEVVCLCGAASTEQAFKDAWVKMNEMEGWDKSPLSEDDDNKAHAVSVVGRRYGEWHGHAIERRIEWYEAMKRFLHPSVYF